MTNSTYLRGGLFGDQIWRVDASDNVTLHNTGSRLDITIDHTSQFGGDTRIHFVGPPIAGGPPPSPSAAYPGLEIPATITVHNSMSSSTIDGYSYILKNANGGSGIDFLGHPNDYGHFHNVNPQAFPGSLMQLFAPNGQPGALGGSSPFTPAGNRLVTDDDILPGQSKTLTGTGTGGTITLGSDHTPGTYGSFDLIFHPTYIANPQATVAMPRTPFDSLIAH